MGYGWGKKSRKPSQTRRLFACRVNDGASSKRHSRIAHCSRLTCMSSFCLNSSTETVCQQLFQFFVGFGERFDRKFQILSRMRGADLGADTRSAVRDHRIEKADYVNAFLEHARGELL